MRRNWQIESYSAAQRLLPQLRARIDAAFAKVDVIAGPTLAVPPPIAGARQVELCGTLVPVVYAMLAETSTFNVSGHPALALPLPWLDHGIPVSLQIAAHRDSEHDLIALARRLEAMPSTS